MWKKAQFGCMKAALLSWEHLSGKLIKQGYKFNLYEFVGINDDEDE
jgi:hypothetical protein